MLLDLTGALTRVSHREGLFVLSSDLFESRSRLPYLVDSYYSKVVFLDVKSKVSLNFNDTSHFFPIYFQYPNF